MTDCNIPFAEATVLPPPMAPSASSSETTRPTLVKGRSSRVLLTNQKSKVLGRAEIDVLKQQGFSTGLANAMTRNNATFPLRIWVVDNSGSMNKTDGNRIVESNKPNARHIVKMVPSTRWAEIQQTVDYHVQMAALLEAPTVFRLLNDPGRAVGDQQFSIAEDGKTTTTELQADVAKANQVMWNAQPGGVTPLTDHVNEIRQNVLQLQPSLTRDGTKVAIILATDGLPTNAHGHCNDFTKNQFLQALRSLEGLPVWIVVRLCTDDEEVVDYYNDLDAQLELDLEVLDDFQGEAQEVFAVNPWLNYGLPLHRCREMGYHNRLFDLLDERLLTLDEVRDFLRILLGDSVMDLDPQGDTDGFFQAVSTLLEKESRQWNPVTKKVAPWVDMKVLRKTYSKGGCTIM